MKVIQAPLLVDIASSTFRFSSNSQASSVYRQSQPKGSATLSLRVVLYDGISTRSGANIEDDFSTLLGQTGKIPLVECHK